MMCVRLFCAGAVLAAPSLTGQARAPAGSVTLTEGTSFGAAVSPDGRSIAFDLHGTLWVAPTAGGTARALTDRLADVRLPQWSPDGKRIALQSYRDGNWHVWVVEAEGERLTQVTYGRSDNREPAWSPDGQSLYFSSDRTGNYHLWRVSLGTLRLDQVTRGDFNAFSPALSRNGTLAYLSRGFPRGAPVRVVVVGTADTARAVFQQPRSRLVALAWLPNGHLAPSATTTIGRPPAPSCSTSTRLRAPTPL